MTNLRKIFNESIEALKRFSFIQTPETDARFIICETIGINLTGFHLERDSLIISPAMELKIKDNLKKRMNGESVAEILGIKEFYGLDFEVDGAVLIPRPETELLVDSILDRISLEKEYNILDIGAGSGAISITLALHLKKSTITALEISPEAVKILKKNINRHKTNNISIINEDLYNFKPQKAFDIIVSNPPYIKSQHVNDLLESKSINDPRIALDGGVDGLDYYREIKKFSDKNLNRNGIVALEHGMGQRSDIINIFSNMKNEGLDDLAGIDRVILFKNT